jgi:hypothetical protein
MAQGRCKMAIYVTLACVGGFLLTRQVVKQVRMRDPVTKVNTLVDRCRNLIADIDSSLSQVAQPARRAAS